MNRFFPSRLTSLAIILVTHTVTCLAQDKLSGSTTVSSTGAAVYSIAIEAPKGVGDLIPSIGIAYNSQSGNGLVGYGCNITGLSAITRGTKTIAHDNTVKGISYDSTCALYLDGKRLLLKSGTEGTDGCVYAPEGEALTNVTLHYSLSNTSCWFEVDTNDGMIYEYGHNGGQQSISNPSAVAAWHITKATNPMGQTITYQYSTDGLYLYPQTISYGGDNTVNFTYEARTDSIFFSLRNCRGYVAQRLKTITTKAGDNTFRTYTMSYNTTSDGSTTKFSRLTTINETGENGNSSHNLTAQWNYLPSYSANCQESSVTLPAESYYVEYGERYLLSGDLNNDGISDIIHVSPVKEYIYRYENAYQFSLYTYAHIYKSQVSNGSVTYQEPLLCRFPQGVSMDEWTFQKGSASVIDVNGDGQNDLIFPCITNVNYNGTYSFYFEIAWGDQITNGCNSHVNYGTALITGNEIPLYAIIDLNRNGKNEVAILEKQGTNNQYALHLSEFAGNNTPAYLINFTLTTAPRRLFTSDFNHDGLTDFIVVCDDGYRIFYNQGGTSLQNLFVNNSTLNNSVTNHERMESGDFNGDGILDFIWNDNNSSQLYFELGNADGTFTRQLAYNLDFNVINKNSNDGTWNCLVTDLDQDGKSDVVLNLAHYIYYISTNWIYHDTHTYWLLSNGTSLTKKKEATSTREDDAKSGHLFAGDFKGNGYLEIGNYGYDCYNSTNANVNPTLNIYSCSNHNITIGKASQFQDSNGRKVAFAYSSMTSDLVYTKGTGSNYPVIDIAAPICVTSQVSEFGGSPIATQTNYTYKGLRAHLQGRGLLGFRETTASDTNTGKTVKNTTSNDFPDLYIPQTITTTTSQAGTTSTSVSTICPYVYDNTHNNYKSYVISQTTTDIYGNVTTVANEYNVNYGTLVIEQDSKDGGDFYRKTTYVYSPEKIAGAHRLVSTIQEQEHPDDSDSFVKETDYTYDSYGRRTSMTEFPGESLQLTTTYQYDSYGNVIKKKFSGYGISNDTETNYMYSSDGKFLTQKSDIARTVSYTCNAFGDVMAETDNTNSSNPLTTTYTRNGFGTITREDKPTGETTIWTRVSSSEYGGSYCITDSSNYAPVVKTWYDALGNEMRTETTGIGGVEISTTNTCNVRGELTAKTNVHGNLTTSESYTYDVLGRMTASASSDGNSVSYAYDDREVSITKNNQTYIKNYDAWGNVMQADDPVSSVSYYYDAIGKPGKVETENNMVEIEYDECGNQISLDDPDAGLTTYQYDALHRIISQTDARGNVTTFSYDGAGRITQKTVGGTTTTYTYGTTGNGAGRLIGQQTGDRTITYTYDDNGRLSQETRSMIGEPSLTFGYSYDFKGRINRRTYPQGVNVEYAYNGNYLVATAIGDRNISFISSDNGLTNRCTYGGKLKNTAFIEMEPIGEPAIFPGGTALLMGGGLPPTPEDSLYNDPGLIYNPDEPWQEAPELAEEYFVEDSLGTYISTYDTRGFLTSLTIKRGNVTQHAMTYNFGSGTGNLLSRSGMTSQTETFTYDNLDRLTQVSGANLYGVTYNNEGNIISKSGPGSYSYASSHPHAVISVTNPQGSISSATQAVTYTAFGKIQTISDNGYTMDFTYGPDEERWKTVLQHGDTVIRTTVYGDNYERVTENGVTRHFYYLDNGAVYVLQDGSTSGQLYFGFKDHLGSFTRLYSEYGNEVFAAEYDAWGQQAVTTDSLHFRRGYTGHEMLPEFGLINMNGRLYDPYLARFLSPDNYVQMPDFSQSFNRYSYCLNNPLKYTDPDGEIAWWVVAAFVGGAFNVAANMDDINNAGDFFGYFGVGAVAGVVGGATGGLVIGTGGILGGAAAGFVGGATSGFLLGSGNSIVANGWDLSAAFDAGVNGMITGAMTGAVIGGAVGGISAYKQGKNIWTGKKDETLQWGTETQRHENTSQQIENAEGKHISYDVENRKIIVNNDNIDLGPTIDRINQNQTIPSYRHDGSIFRNQEHLLPLTPGEYREWVVPTSGINNAGPMRIVTKDGFMWFTIDHYKSFIPLQ